MATATAAARTVAREAPRVFTAENARALLSVLLGPERYFMEQGPPATLGRVLARMQGMKPDFAVSLTTASAFGDAVSQTVALALEHHFRLLPSQRTGLWTCLQEALANAVMHGNLELASPAQTNDLEQYYGMAAARMEEETYASRRIFIAAWKNGTRVKLGVSDEGKGFRQPPYTQAPEKTLPSGRGLPLIASMAEQVWVGADNRTLYIAFGKQPAA